jgi:hypothetical protein
MCSPDRSWVDYMQLASRDGQSLDLRILGYQFPHLETQQYDSNWLIVSGNVTGPIGSWQFSDPCLLTYEAERLASWMDAVADGNRPSYTCHFIEPCLEFRALLRIDRPVLRVCFDHKARPPSASGEHVWVEFPIEELDLKLAARQWRAELAKYPQRASR